MTQDALKLMLCVAMALALTGCQGAETRRHGKVAKVWRQVSREQVLAQKEIPVYTYRVIRTYPHRTDSYTEGLLLHDGVLYEATGRYNESWLVKADLDTAKARRERVLPKRYFGEGVTVHKDRVYQLTYKSNIGFIYDKDTLKPIGSFHYPTQGWGLTTDGKQLIMSNGSAALMFLDPVTLERKRFIIVKDNISEVGFLNELEYVNGEVFANVWQTNLIARIDPKTGKVNGWIDLTGLNPEPKKLKYPYVLNGIAYDRRTRRLLVTGKCWPAIYEIELVPRK